MKHLKTITTALTILFFAASCKKQAAEPTPLAAAKKLQTIITSGAGSPTNQSFTYDTNGRLIKEEDNDGYRTYEYSSNTVLIKDFNKLVNKLGLVINGTIDNAGRIATFAGINYNGNVPVNQIAVFTYDANGYITQYKRTNNNVSVYTYDFTVTDGDYTKLIVRQNGAELYTQTTDFFTDKIAQSVVENDIPESFCYNTGLFGKTNTHLAKYRQELLPGALLPVWKYNMAYTLDNDGYIQTILSSGSSSTFATYGFQ